MDPVTVVPAKGEAGTQVSVVITGGPDCVLGTNSVVTFHPASTITHGEVTPIEYNSIETLLTIPADAAPGLQRVSVLTTGGALSCVGEDAFLVGCDACGGSLISVSPDRGEAGASLQVTIVGEGTTFDAGSQVGFSGAGISVGGVQVSSPTRLTAQLAIAADAPEGARDVTVTTGAQIAAGPGLFRVEAVALEVTPATGEQGALLPTLSLSGGGVDMGQVTTALLGPDIQVGGLQALSATELSLSSVAISLDAEVGAVDVILLSPAGSRTFPDAFGVTQGPATRLVSASLASADRGHPGIAFSLVGEHTHFDAGELVAGLSGQGSRADGVVADDATHLSGDLVLAESAAEGGRDWVAVVDNGRCGGALPCERVSLADAFEVTAPGAILSVTPERVEAGVEVDVAIVAQDGAFVADATSLHLDPPDGIEVLSVTVSGADALSARLRVSAEASGVPRSLKTVAGPEVALGQALLDVHHPEIVRVIPSSVPVDMAGITLRVECVDLALDAAAQVSVSGEGLTLGAISFDPAVPDQLRVALDVAASAPLGPRDLSVTAGGVTAVAEAALRVVAAPGGGDDEGGCASAGAGPAGSGLGLAALLALARRQRPRRAASRR